jgi:hypothetical protein
VRLLDALVPVHVLRACRLEQAHLLLTFGECPSVSYRSNHVWLDETPGTALHPNSGIEMMKTCRGDEETAAPL